MKIGFHTNSLTLRGTEIALYDYAVHNQTMLGNESVVFYRQRNPANQSVLDKFAKQFNVVAYDGQDQLNRLIEQRGIDLAYFIKSGERDDAICSSVPSLIHAVFPTNPEEFHGDKYAFVSEWLSKEYSNKKIPFVPHMIQLPDHLDDLRSHLAIPSSATVIGSYGGADSFNLTFVQEAIVKALQKRTDLYFVFMNITPFAEHERLIFLPGNSDLVYKVKFINTCDGMIHARGIGESFGLSCGEFSIKGKPIITYAMSPQRSHIEILGNKAILYKSKRDLEDIFFNFNQRVQYQQNWDAYSTHFSPAPIMKQFKAVFIDGENRAGLTLGLGDRAAIQAYRLQRKLRNLSRKLYR
jgi:hypothetical protein